MLFSACLSLARSLMGLFHLFSYMVCWWKVQDLNTCLSLSFWVSSCCVGINWALCFIRHFIFPGFSRDWREKTRPVLIFSRHQDRSYQVAMNFSSLCEGWKFLTTDHENIFLKTHSSSFVSVCFHFPFFSPCHTWRCLSKKQVTKVKLNHQHLPFSLVGFFWLELKTLHY